MVRSKHTMSSSPNAMIFRSGVLRLRAKSIRPSPSLFYFPGLRQQYPVWDYSKCSNDFPWMDTLQSKVETIKEEYLALVSEVGEKELEGDYSDHDGLHKGSWKWYSFMQKGKFIGNAGGSQSVKEQHESITEKLKYHCPKTIDLLQNVIQVQQGIPFSYAFFSRLSPGSSIQAHSAPMNLR